MSKTIDGVPAEEIEFLWMIEDNKVIDFFGSIKQKNQRRRMEILRLNVHLGYSTEAAATLALIEQINQKLIQLDKENKELQDIVNRLKMLECVTIKSTPYTGKKPEIVGNVRI